MSYLVILLLNDFVNLLAYYEMKTILKQIVTYSLFVSLFVSVSCTDEELNINEKSVAVYSRSVNEEPQKMLICGTDHNLLSRASTTPPISVKAIDDLSKNIYIYNVYIHIIRGLSDNHGITDDKKDGICATLMDRLNRGFFRRSIFFNLIGSEFIDSDTYDGLTENNASDIFGVNSNSSAINIYIFTNTDDPDDFAYIGGEANDIPGTAFWVSLRSYYTETPIHEMGHVLGLYHTFQGTKNNTNPEYVDGTDSDKRGDYIVDTPADPDLSDAYGYFIGTINDVDAHGDVYAPDTTNYMSYYINRYNFSTGQEAWMRTYIEDRGNFSQFKVSNDVILGNNFLKDNYSTTYSLASIFDEYYLLDCWEGTSIDWNVKMEAYSNSQANVVTLNNTYSGETITLSSAGEDYPSQKYTISTTITDYRGYKFTSADKIVHYTRGSLACGTYRWESVRAGSTLSGSTNGSTPIRTRPGDVLYIWYEDELGGGTMLYPTEYNFMIMGTMASYLQKRSTNSFYCATNTAIGSTSLLLQTTVCGRSNIVSLPINIVSSSTMYNIQEDSLDFSIDSIYFVNEPLKEEL